MSSGVQCPFLYQTRTILRQPSRVRGLWPRTIVSAPDRKTRDLTANEQDQGRISFLQQKAMDVVAKNSRTKSHPITQQESAAFDDIWKLFESSTSPSSTTPKRDITATAKDHTDTDHQAILELFSSAPAQNQNHGRYEGTASTGRQPVNSSSSFSFSRSLPSQTTKSAAVAEIAGYLSDQTQSTSLSQQDDLLHQTALNIMSDISVSFDAALKSPLRHDYAIWSISEEKIFPLIKLLVPPQPSLSNSPLSQSSTQSQPSDSRVLSQAHPLIPSSLPLLPLLSRTYPAALLLTLRLLYTRTPSSPYILALLPYIKSLGPTSYVLGVNTYFYNCILAVRWNIYSDFRAIDSLLAEMERNGVEFDTGTLAVLRLIADERKFGVHGKEKGDHYSIRKNGKTEAYVQKTDVDYGSRGSDWWERREVKKGLDRLEEWTGIVGRRLEERGLGEVMREGQDMIGSRDEESESAYVVTL